MKKRFKKFFKIAGPGVVTGAADNDPSGIATYSQTGAQFGLGQLWTALYMLPFLIAVQEACARIGAVTGYGLTSVVKENYNKTIMYILVFLILIANTINIGADIGAMAEAGKLITPINFVWLALFFTVLMLILQIFLTYKVYANVLKWLCLSLLAYPLTVLIVNQPWNEVFRATVIPHIELNFKFLFIIIGVFGTTISPYMFFWQTSQVVEEKREAGLSMHKNPHLKSGFMKKIRIDNFMGMVFSEIATWSIILVAATLLHKHGITEINSAADAAKALEPLVQSFPNAGYFSKVIFAIGIIGLGLLSVPVLAGSIAYAVSAAFEFPRGLDLKFHQAKLFYAVIIFAMLFGLLLNFIGIDPIKALVYAAVINGIVAVPMLFMIGLIMRNKKIMGKHCSGRLSYIFIWLTFFFMALSAIAAGVMWIKGIL